MIRLHIPALLTAAALAVFSSPAGAQMRCGPAAGILADLKGYNEQPRFLAVGPDGVQMLNLWFDEDDGSWTITVRTTAGAMCILAAGVANGAMIPAKPKGDPS